MDNIESKRGRIDFRLTIAVCLLFGLIITMGIWAYLQPPTSFEIGGLAIRLPLPLLTDASIHYSKGKQLNLTTEPGLFPQYAAQLAQEYSERKVEIRQAKIDKAEALFRDYGSNLVGYGHIIVDQASACGGDWRILIGIAGSESGLGRINYKLYNPFGYLDGVQYANYTEALTILSCKISTQHLAPCGQDLYCLARRYAGPSDDLEHFVSKIRYFVNRLY